MQRTKSLIAVLLALMAAPDDRHWGYKLSKAAGVRSGVLYPILHRLLNEGWLADGWEAMTDQGRKRPPRRYYEITDEGRREMGALLAEAAQDVRHAAAMSPRLVW